MLQNLGTTDRLLRIAFGLSVVVLYHANLISGAMAVLLGAVALVLLLTGLFGVCPLYALIGIRSTLQRDDVTSSDRLIDLDGTILDVRTEAEFDQGHVQGALNIPLSQVVSRMEDIGALKQPLQVCCRSGNRSGQAVVMIKAHSIPCRNVGGWKSVKRQLIKQQAEMS